MDGERAETFLRLLAEAALRDQLAPDPAPWWDGPGAARDKVNVAGQALTAVGALDRETLQEVLAEFDLAVSVRQLHGPHPGPAGPYPARARRASSRVRLASPLPPGRLGPSLTQPAQAGGTGGGRLRESTGSPEPAAPPPAGDDPDQGAAARFAPIGRTLPFDSGGLRGELYLVSFAHTGAGARLIVAWGTPSLSREQEPGPRQAQAGPGGLLTVTDDRGCAYELEFTAADGSEWASQIELHPAPPDGIRWLEVAAPPGPAVRVNLNPASGPPGGEPRVSPASLSAGEQLLIMLAEELLMVAVRFPLAQRAQWPGHAPPVAAARAAGLGGIVAGLEAVDVLPPLSPVPAWLAALCAGLGLGGHGIAAAPADDLPEPWLSMLTYYQRRKPDTGEVRDGFAAVTAALPELDGIRLALLGLHNSQGSTTLHVLARGGRREPRPGPHGINLDFALSVWLRDNGGRWHVARPAGWQRGGPERSIGLAVMPPLPRSTTWVEVLAGGRSGQVRARLPLRWGSPP